MKTLCSLPLLLFVTLTFAQEKPPILTTAKPQKGIYRNFQEFLLNAPSIQSPFKIICKSGENKVEKGIADYKLELLDSATKRRDLKKVWGVCDGESVYVNEISYSSLNFKKIHGLGRYCYFYGSVPSSGPIPVMVPGVGSAPIDGVVPVPVGGGEGAYILNLNNGKFFLLDREMLKTILKKDPELYEQYAEDERRSKRETLLSYIPRYNQRHEDEIKFNHSDPVQVTFYRRNKKESPDALTIISGDTVKMTLVPNSMRQITWIGDSLDICIGSNCKTIPLQAKGINYIECSLKGDDADCKSVDKKIGEFYSNEVRVLNERKQ